MFQKIINNEKQNTFPSKLFTMKIILLQPPKQKVITVADDDVLTGALVGRIHRQD